MRAVLCHDWGGPECLAIGEVAPPVPGPGEVAVRVAAAGVNFADILMIAGKYQEKPPFPFSPGLEVAGSVEACGPGVTRVAPGQRVLALTDWGGCRADLAAPSSFDARHRCKRLESGASALGRGWVS